MALEVIDTRWRDGAVDAIPPQIQAEPVSAQGVVGAGRHLLQHGLSFAAHFFLDRFGHQPGLVCLPIDDPEVALRGGPAGLAQADGVGGNQFALAEVEQHALRQIDEEAIVEYRRDDVGRMDVQRLAGMESGVGGQAVLPRQQFGFQTEAGADGGQGVALLDAILGIGARHVMRQRRRLLCQGREAESRQQAHGHAARGRDHSGRARGGRSEVFSKGRRVPGMAAGNMRPCGHGLSTGSGIH